LGELKPKGPKGKEPKHHTALFCISFLRKGEVLAYVGRIYNLKDLKKKDLKEFRTGRPLCIVQVICGVGALEGSKFPRKRVKHSSALSKGSCYAKRMCGTGVPRS